MWEEEKFFPVRLEGAVLEPKLRPRISENNKEVELGEYMQVFRANEWPGEFESTSHWISQYFLGCSKEDCRTHVQEKLGKKIELGLKLELLVQQGNIQINWILSAVIFLLFLNPTRKIDFPQVRKFQFPICCNSMPRVYV